MNIILIILIVLLVLATIIGCFAAICGINKINKEKYKKIFDKNVNKIVQEMSEQFDKYLENQEKDLQDALKDINNSFEERRQNISAQIALLNEGLEKAKERHEQQLKELEENTATFVNNRSKAEAAQIQSIIDYYQTQQNQITEEFEDFKNKVETEKRTILNELNKEKKKQAEIIEQYRKAEEVKQNQDFYRISISENEKSDIKKLKDLSYSFSKPEILLKLIYETYYKTKMEELFKRVLGENKDAAGIYKITNIENNKVYIGKTTKFIDRFRTHAKRGCGIERITGLLYDAMFDEGLENFTWEIVMTCSKDELSEKEKEMIDFYKSNEYGYNIRKG